MVLLVLSPNALVSNLVRVSHDLSHRQAAKDASDKNRSKTKPDDVQISRCFFAKCLIFAAAQGAKTSDDEAKKKAAGFSLVISPHVLFCDSIFRFCLLYDADEEKKKKEVEAEKKRKGSFVVSFGAHRCFYCGSVVLIPLHIDRGRRSGEEEERSCRECVRSLVC